VLEDDYLAALTARLDAALDLVGVYVVGSYARGGYDRATSDLDVLAVGSGDLDAVVATCSHDALPVPARKLELVVYEPDGATVALNLNTGAAVETTTTAGHGEWFWFAIDRAVAREHGRVLFGPPPASVIAPVDDATIERALTDLVAWYERHEPEHAATAWSRADAWRHDRVWITKLSA
jgi:hypothetical protein